MASANNSCPNCGAPVAAAAGNQILTCEHCSSQLEIKKDGQVVMSEMSKDLRLIRFHKKLELLDQEWQRTCAAEGVPTGVNLKSILFLIVLWFLILKYMPRTWGWLGQSALIAAVITAGVVVSQKKKFSARSRYENRLRAYQTARAGMLGELKKIESRVAA